MVQWGNRSFARCVNKVPKREHDFVRPAAMAAGINFDNLTHDAPSDTVINGTRKKPLTKTALESFVTRLDPGASGIGKATLFGAIATGSALRAQRPEFIRPSYQSMLL